MEGGGGGLDLVTGDCKWYIVSQDDGYNTDSRSAWLSD